MFDMHYDLLTLLYVLKDNKKYLKEVEKNINNNLTGLIANLYFMNKKEMKEELNIKKINVVKMYKKSIQIYNKLNIRVKTLFSIEGCDYIKNTRQLKKLKNLGLNAIILTWNNKNKYGSGFKTNSGLTKKGEKLIKKAIDLNIAIDLSHANEKTFFDIIKIIKKYPKKTVCYASHSNIYTLHQNQRNLTDKQINALKEIDAYLGIVLYSPFLTNKNNIKESYIKHIKYAKKKLGVDKIVLSSDNMEFYDKISTKPKYYPSIIKYKNIKKEIAQILKNEFSNDEIEKIMYKNAEKIYQKL